MDTPLPLRIHIGKDKPPLILFNNQLLGRLSQFQLHAVAGDNVINTMYLVTGCYPDWETPPDNAMSNQAYPLRMAFGHTSAEAHITYAGRPIGRINQILLQFTANPDMKPVIRMTIFDHPEYKELLQELLDLNVEVIVEPTPESLKLLVLGA
jgi:hypothetical protein